jgi:aminopeptidase YwaD
MVIYKLKMNLSKVYMLVGVILFIGLNPVLTSGQDLNKKQIKTLTQLQKDIKYLASDELKGRATGTEGERLSAEYIADAFERNKLEPKGEQGYFQQFTITTLRIAKKSSEFKLNGNALSLYNEYYPLSFSSNNAEANSGIVDVGFGISSEDRNDYVSVDAKGKIALINIGSPDGIHPHSKYLAWHGISIRVEEAIKHGVSAVVFYRTSENVKKPSGELSLKMTPSSIPVVFLDQVRADGSDLKFASIKIEVLTDEDQGYNVIGFNDNGADRTVVIGAHHDHLGQGQHGNSLAENTSEIHNGADDNASGTAGLFALAKMLKKCKKWNKNNNYLFIAFSGEEMGLVGSKYFVDNPTIDLKTINYMVNMDMIGMLNEDKVLIINGVGTSPIFSKTIEDLTSQSDGISTVNMGTSGIGPSDHTSFYLSGIPAIHYFTGAHDHYHKPTDDIENLNYNGEVFVLQHIVNLITELNDDDKIEFSETKDESKSGEGKSRMNLEVTLGVVPNYGFNGEGMQVDAVRPGKPGGNAGMLAKDIVISLAGISIGNMQDYMDALGTLKKGDTADVVVRRKDAVITLKVQF